MNISRHLSHVARAKIGVPRLRSYLLATLVLLGPGLTSGSTAQITTPQQTDENLARNAARRQSTVRGRVIYDDTRRPLRRVQVTIYDPAAKSNIRHLVAWTDGRGEFQIKDVPFGKYFVVVTAPGIISLGFDASDEAQGTSVAVDGNSKPDVVVRVKRGGAISGKVTYADGDPALNASIKILHKKDGQWTPIYVGTRSNDRVLTDERGAYRVSGLSPGDYLVGAAEEKWGLELYARDDPDGSTLLNRALLIPTYYDGTTNLTDATVLTVRAGSEEMNINIILADRPVYTISGLVTLKGDNHPIARARISLKRRGEDLPYASDLEEPVTNTDVMGRFTFDEVQDGSYTITITPPQSSRREESLPVTSQSVADTSQRFVTKKVEVNIVGADLADLNIEVSSGSRISGIVEVEGGKAMPPTVFVYAGATEGRVQQDRTFVVEGVPSGGLFLRTSVPPFNKYYTRSVTVGKTELLRGPLVVKEGEDINNVRIVISPDVALLSGRALSSDGKSPQAGVAVVLVSVDADQHKIYGSTNADGNFRMSGAPGEYLLIVLRSSESPYQLNGDALASRIANAQRIVLQPGENTRMDIVVPREK